MTICERIDNIIQMRGISRRMLATKAGIAPSSFQSAMQRNKELSLEMLIPIAKVLRLSIGILFDNDDSILFRYGDDERVFVYDISGNEIADNFYIPVGELPNLYDVLRAEPEKLTFQVKERIEQENERLDDLKRFFFKLNEDGQNKAIDRIAELTEIPKYQK